MKKLVLDNEEILIIDRNRMVSVDAGGASVADSGYGLATRGSGSFRGKALYLDRAFEWVLGQDDEGITCLVPLRRI